MSLPLVLTRTDPRPAPIELLSDHAPTTAVATALIRHHITAEQILATTIAHVPLTTTLTTPLLQTTMTMHHTHVIIGPLVALVTIHLSYVQI